MKKDKILPMQDLQIFGIYKDGKFTIPDEQVRALKNGRMTDIVELKNLKGGDLEIDSLPVRLSIVRGHDGEPSLRIDPVYREPNSHPHLSEDEQQRLVRSEIANIKKNYIDEDGNVRIEVIEYDNRTKQFMSFDPTSVKSPDAVDGQKLTPEQKRKYKEGEVVELSDGTEFQISTTDKKGIKSNRGGFILSVILDGGMSYLLITGLQRMIGKKSTEEESYSQGYIDGIKEVQKQVEQKLARNPKNRDAAYDLDMTKQELSKIAAANSATRASQAWGEVDLNSGKNITAATMQSGINVKRNDDYKRKL